MFLPDMLGSGVAGGEGMPGWHARNPGKN